MFGPLLTFSAGSGQMKPVLRSRYNAINRANEVIAGIETSGKMSDPDEGSDFKNALTASALIPAAHGHTSTSCATTATARCRSYLLKTGDNFNVGRVDRDIVC